MATIKLALVDDELMSRNTIKKYLEGNGTYEIAADFQNGKMALEWLRKNSYNKCSAYAFPRGGFSIFFFFG